jgi:hypothetical protein
MHNLVQLLNAGRLVSPRSAKRSFCQPRAIDATIRVEDSRPEMPQYLPINSFARLHELMGNRISLNQLSAERHKHFADYGFARSNPAGQSDFQQSSLI